MNTRANKNRAQRSTKNRAKPRQVDDEVDLGSNNPNMGLRKGYKTPKPFTMTPTYFRKLRFTVGTAVATQVFTASNILDFMCFSVAVNTAYRVARSIRLRYVEIWEPFNGIGAITNVGLRWEGAVVAPNLPMTSTTLYASSSGPDYPAHLIAHPVPGTYQDWWHNAADNASMFEVFSLAEGAIMDIAFDWTTYETLQSTLVSTPVVVGAVGLNAIHSPNVNITALGLFDI